MTLASIVEREAVVPEERPAIAGVYLNRLAARHAAPGRSDRPICPGLPAGDRSVVEDADLPRRIQFGREPVQYLSQPGLPPGPIAAPGLSSIAAVLAPEAHDYLFFVALPDGSGRHVFATTFEEHQENVRRYQQGN